MLYETLENPLINKCPGPLMAVSPHWQEICQCRLSPVWREVVETGTSIHKLVCPLAQSNLWFSVARRLLSNLVL